MTTQPAPAATTRSASPATTAPAPRWAVRAAHSLTLLVLPGGLWRLALVLGFPAGYTAAGFVPFETPSAKAVMLSLSVGSELIALLTLGLVRPWGETVPHWLPFIGGRRVRPLAAALPALLGGLVLTFLWAGLPWWWTFPHADMTRTGHLVVGLLYFPQFFWGPLTVALAVSYWRRTRVRSGGVARSALDR